MDPDPAAGHQPSPQADRMRAAIDSVVALGPSFLRGDIDADQMTTLMVGAVQDYLDREASAGGDGHPHDAEAAELQGILAELLGCGSGYLAGRCDAACVGRTITAMVRQFGAP